jgi:hypothetical protein
MQPTDNQMNQSKQSETCHSAYECWPTETGYLSEKQYVPAAFAQLTAAVSSLPLNTFVALVIAAGVPRDQVFPAPGSDSDCEADCQLDAEGNPVPQLEDWMWEVAVADWVLRTSEERVAFNMPHDCCLPDLKFFLGRSGYCGHCSRRHPRGFRCPPLIELSM